MRVEEQSIVSFQVPAVHAGTGQLACRQDASAAGMQQVNIHIDASADGLGAAGGLLRRMYAWRGYALAEGLAHAHRITLVAESGGQAIGTMSLWFDRQGALPADEEFGDRLDLLRAQGRRLCEPSRLAIDKGMSKRVFAALIHVSYIYAHHIQGFSDYVIEVNPRHVTFYKRMLGFADFGGERACARVGAPAVLLRLPLEQMGAQIRQWGGLMEQHGGERSFYPYFFALRDEAGITARLVSSCVQRSAA